MAKMDEKKQEEAEKKEEKRDRAQEVLASLEQHRVGVKDALNLAVSMKHDPLLSAKVQAAEVIFESVFGLITKIVNDHRD